MENQKSRGIAILLALFLGGVGGHRFYLGQITAGVLMLLFFWTFIPVIIAIIDIIRYLLMSDAEFQKRYGVVVPGARPVGSAIEELEKLATLKEKGHITEEEFLKKKAELLK
jgi:TM2 domain-containing membrane protein YozV